MITNNSLVQRNLVDFVVENPYLIGLYINTYLDSRDDWEAREELEANERIAQLAKDALMGRRSFTQEALIASAEDNNEFFAPGEKKVCVFGDEQGTLIGKVFDFILRDGGKSANFTWELEEMLR